MPRKKKPSFDINAPAESPAPAAAAGWVYKSKADPDEMLVEVVDVPALDLRGTPADDEHASAIVKRFSVYAAGAGLVPLPVVDMAAIAVIELKMVQELAAVYKVPFSHDRARPIVASLIGGYAATELGYGAGGMLLKTVPLIGPALAVLAVPGFAAGLTWAIGRAFILHFASGGTFLTLDLEWMRLAVARARQTARSEPVATEA